MAEQLSKSIQNIMNTDPSNIDRESDEFKEFLQDGSLGDLTQLAHNAKFDGEDDLLGSVYGEIEDRIARYKRDDIITEDQAKDKLEKINKIIESDPADNNQPAVQKLAATAVTVANKPNNLNTTSANSGKAANTLPNSTKSNSNAPTPLTMPSKIPKPKIKRKSRGNASNSNSKGNNNANAASANTASSKPAPNPNKIGRAHV